MAAHPHAEVAVGSFSKDGERWKYTMKDVHFETTFRFVRDVEGKRKESWIFLKRGQLVELREGDQLEFRVTTNDPGESFYIGLLIEGFTQK